MMKIKSKIKAKAM